MKADKQKELNVVQLIDSIVKFEVKKETEFLKFKILEMQRGHDEQKRRLESLIRQKLKIYQVLQEDEDTLFSLKIISIREAPQGLIINVSTK